VADVLYVPELKMNLLSVSAMEDRGYTISFKDGWGSCLAERI
jgi:hypothetical protein